MSRRPEQERHDERGATQAPPHSPEAERAVLGGVLLLPEVLGRVQALGLLAEHFFVPGNAVLWEAMTALGAAEQPIDSITLRDWLVGSKKLVRAGGDEYLEKLTETIPTVSNITAHAKIVLEKAARRRKREALMRGLAAANTGELEDADEAARQALEVRATHSVVLYTPRQIIQASEDAAISRTRGIGGLRTGYRVLDPHIEHMDPGEVITVGGNSGCGKSHVILGIAMNVARSGHKVGIVSTEDPRKRWGGRLAAKLHAGLSVSIIANPQISFEQRERIEVAKAQADRMGDLFRYAEAPNEGLDVVLEQVDALLEWGAELIALDHFHAMQLPTPTSGQNHTNIVTAAVISLVHRSRRAGAVLLLGAQFSQPDTNRPFAEPTMRAFKDSRQFEISSDYSLLLWKPSDADNAPIYGKLGKVKDKPNRPRFQLEFADNGALFDLSPYTPPRDDNGKGGWGRASRSQDT